MTFGVVRPAEPMGDYYRNGVADEMFFVHEGTGTLETNFGPIEYGPGDYLVIPIGTTYRLMPAAGVEQRMLWLECPSEIEPPRRYRNEYGQLLEHSPYCEPRHPAAGRDGAAHRGRRLRGRGARADRITPYHYHHHPFDVVGWDGYL